VQNVTTFEVTIEIANPSTILKPGMNADWKSLPRTGKTFYMYPMTLFWKNGATSKKVTVLKDGIATGVEVKTGVSNWEYTEIISGLVEDEVVSKALNNKQRTNSTSSTPRPPGLFWCH